MMTLQKATAETQAKATRSSRAVVRGQKSRVHEKSRGGCQNCRLRHVKCDQNRPQCMRCLSYGVHCTFVNGVPELQIAALGTTHIIEPKYRALSTASHWTGPSQEAALLASFRYNVAATISFGKRLSLFQNEIVALTSTSPSLRHAMLSLTLMHNRHNLVWSHPSIYHRMEILPLSEHEIGHWFLATSSFNTDLRLASTNSAHQQLGIHQQAALSATSALLAVLTFCYIEATKPAEAWPLSGGTSPSASEDLQWIKLSNGKLSAQTLTQGLASDPIFRALVHVDLEDKSQYPPQDTIVVSNDHEYLFCLEQKLYGREVDAFKQIMHSSCFITTIFSFWSFIGGMTAEFEYGLRYKEPAALLVLLHWYAKLNPIPIWWLKARTTLESQAICIYLDRYYGHDIEIKRQLLWPASILLNAV